MYFVVPKDFYYWKYFHLTTFHSQGIHLWAGHYGLYLAVKVNLEKKLHFKVKCGEIYYLEKHLYSYRSTGKRDCNISGHTCVCEKLCTSLKRQCWIIQIWPYAEIQGVKTSRLETMQIFFACAYIVFGKDNSKTWDNPRDTGARVEECLHTALVANRLSH